MMGRPVDLGHYTIDEIDEFDDVDDAESSIINSHDDSWYVQVGANDVKLLSREQVIDFHRLGVIIHRRISAPRDRRFLASIDGPW